MVVGGEILPLPPLGNKSTGSGRFPDKKVKVSSILSLPTIGRWVSGLASCLQNKLRGFNSHTAFHLYPPGPLSRKPVKLPGGDMLEPRDGAVGLRSPLVAWVRLLYPAPCYC